MGKVREFKESIEYTLQKLYINIGITQPTNHDDILDFIASDVINRCDPNTWEYNDIAISFKKWIKNK
jgi:hypothetical protein